MNKEISTEPKYNNKNTNRTDNHRKMKFLKDDAFIAWFCYYYFFKKRETEKINQ
jgi:hypothetical protein